MDDRASLLRILDANLNRSAEALRVAEDVCRFHWSLSGFAADLKALRHEVLAAVCGDGARRDDLLRHRDIEGDVGRVNASPPGATGAPSLAFRNLERAKEALRAMEEACRIVRPEAARGLEAARYRLYAIEKGLGHLPPASDLKSRLARTRVCLLATAELSRIPLADAVRAALLAGVEMVQLREKTLADRSLLNRARELRELTARHGALFIVNDRPDIALLSHADGVHLGQGDLAVADARRAMGTDLLVGVSTHSLEQARDAERQGADYIGAGPMFATATKDAGAILGPERLREVAGGVTLPLFAIGGITAERVGLVANAGARRIAVSSAILGSDDPAAAVKALLEGLK
jgi:thiamine-phosphate pyrophosphorylase